MALLDDIDDLKNKNKDLSERLRTCELSTALNKQAIINLQKVMIDKLDTIRSTQLEISNRVDKSKPLSNKVKGIIVAVSIGVTTAFINIALHYTGVDTGVDIDQKGQETSQK